ncbi:pPIWI-associating nuclease domain-containing protein [Jiella marina]|uniref:pPIWI-associating nuclease domain-containing protein n=1 Tax=Jiella sp. LLJ827 TaxID=2917712 RepID=UPI0021008E3A|nr:hypothetical protein [Jiella sp. LLJ827]MCQ0987156.1 hypothetical protein [Jiella sp. LLJ827]
MPEKLSEAADDYDITSDASWNDLDILSTHTEYEGLEVFAESGAIAGEDLTAPGVVHVTLNYGSKSDEGFATSESFPAIVHFTADPEKKTVEIVSLEIDTSSFYGDGDGDSPDIDDTSSA